MDADREGKKKNSIIKRISPYTIKKAFLYLKHYGPKEFFVRLREKFEPWEIPYDPWFQAYKPKKEELERQREISANWDEKLSIIVPAYKTNTDFLSEMIESLIEQSYVNWELCIANASPDNEEMQKTLAKYSNIDNRIKYINLKNNYGIAENTNRVLDLASGRYAVLLDHDDIISPNALFLVAKAIRENDSPDFIYTDEDKITMDSKEHFAPHLKPDFNIDLLRSNNYICHMVIVKIELIKKIGGFRSVFDGAQDYDFVLRCVEQTNKIIHIPEILYHWRTHKDSTAGNPLSKEYAYEAGKNAINAHLKRCGEEGEAFLLPDFGFYRVKYGIKGEPLVSIIIPNKDQKDTLEKCINSIVEKTSYKNYEIIIVENNSKANEIFEYYKEVESKENIRVIKYKGEFNYSAINNFAVKYAKGQYYLFLNNDISIISKDWLGEMLGVCQRKNVGAVGAKLLYPDNTIQHAGVIIGLGGIAGHVFINMKSSRGGYLHKANLMQDLTAVTAACMMVKASVFNEINGFEEELKVAFNDIDLCIRINKLGYLVVYDPFSTLYHYESKTRGKEDTKEKIRRFQGEILFMEKRWIDFIDKGDPYYNKNLSLKKFNYALKPIDGMKLK